MLPVEAEAADRRLADQHLNLSVREVAAAVPSTFVRAGNLHRAIMAVVSSRFSDPTTHGYWRSALTICVAHPLNQRSAARRSPFHAASRLPSGPCASRVSLDGMLMRSAAAASLAS